MKERSKAEEAFIDQRTRQLLVKWADYSIQNGGLPDPENWNEEELSGLELHPEYFNFAIAKGWLGKTVKDGRRLLTAAGWNTAAAFLKR